MMKFFRTLLSITLLIGSLGFASDCYQEGCPCGNVRVTADYLLWKAHVDQLNYAMDGLNFPTASGETRELDWQWDSGFKVGAGYIFNSGWDVYLNYTWFHTNVKGSATPSGGQALYPTYSNPQLLAISFASSAFDLKYNTLDLELGNALCCTRCFLIHPSFGLRGAWTKDKDDILYVSGGAPETLHLSESFRGVGPRVGLNAVWNVWRGFSLFGEGDYALVWGAELRDFL